ncbi:hypothetical protein KB681_gp40 [Burkholderia phage Mica]|uniref:Putative membrane protein n=1 Tax=Burkholderia phage Mica TaxID=2767579 RepID=A0A873WI75_9CAUD|nr:hypothetical protein KB681_gp40 [Burkholderia phage Mica]QPB08672.1 putative membrane protein [Burkholderia phage Mica]
MDIFLQCMACGFGIGLFIGLPYLLGWGGAEF